MKRVCVYCGSHRGADSRFQEAADELGVRLAEQGIGIVYGGASRGLMGIVADAALRANGQVTGIIPEALAGMEIAHDGLTELHIVGSMHERKTLMADLSDAFVALPGGYGTLEEIIEVLTWAQLGFHNRPCALLNIAGYYDGLFAWLDHAVAQGFVRAEHRAMLLVSDSVDGLLQAFADYEAPVVQKLQGTGR